MTIVIVIYCLMRVKMSGLFVLYQTGGEEKPSKALAVLSFLMPYVARYPPSHSQSCQIIFWSQFQSRNVYIY